MVFGFICAVSMVKIFRVLIIMLFCLIVFFLTEKSTPPEIKEEKEKKAQKKEFSKDEKIEIFRNLFVARYDIYAKKWVSRDGLKQGFFPVTATFQGEDYIPLTNKEIEEHLRGNVFLASYLIDKKQECKYVVMELNSEDVFKLQRALLELNISASDRKSVV